MFPFLQPVRRPRLKAIGSYTGWVPSDKLHRGVGVDSSLEAKMVRLLEVDPTIGTYCEQPWTFEVEFQGKLKRYTPDFAVQRKGQDRITFVEVKPWAKAQKPERAAWHAHLGEFFASEGYDFVVVTEREICRQPRLRNVALIRRFADRRCDEGHRILLAGLCGGRFQMTLGELNALTAANTDLPNAYSFIRDGHARVDMSTALSDRSVVQLEKA